VRFKTIFIIFNAVIILSFLTIFFMPLFLLGSDHFAVFLSRNWFIGGLFLIAIGAFNIYFLSNWTMFGLLEKEDWHTLISYLEKRVFDRGIIRRAYVRLLINSYLITSNTDAILRLQNLLVQKKSRHLRRFAVPLGVPYILQNKPEESEKYFGMLLSDRKTTGNSWIRWNYAFSLMQLKEFEGAKKEFLVLLDEVKEPVLLLLCLYLLHSFPQLDISVRARIEEKIDKLKRTNSPEELEKRIDKEKGRLQVIILSKIIQEAKDWLYKYEPLSKEETIH
jgi:hypothetical protein